MILRRSIDTARAAMHRVRDTGELVASLAWLLADHVRRRLTGRPSLLEEVFGSLDFDLVEEDILPPFEDCDPAAEEARTRQVPRRVNGKGRPK